MAAKTKTGIELLEGAYRDANHLLATENERLKAELEQVKKDLEATQRKSSQRYDAIQQLKSVARFYRGQRDLINGYLSGVLDSIGPKVPRGPSEEQVNAAAQHAAHLRRARDETAVLTNRPVVSEPYAESQDGSSGISGRYFSRYQNEPPRDWEDL